MNGQEEEKVLIRSEDAWGPMYIAQTGQERSLYFSSESPQSSMWTHAPYDLAIEYTQLLMASLLFVDKPRNILLFGLGGGSLAKFLWKTFPTSHIHTVEIRPKLVEWAQEYFFLPSSPRLHLYIDDAAHFVSQQPTQLFDLIIVDLFTVQGMSEKLAGHSFFQRCEKFLEPQGVLGWNVWQSAPKELLEASIGELHAAFGKNILFLPSKTEGNLTLIALPQPLSNYKLTALKAKATKLSAKTHLNFSFLMRAYNNFQTQAV